MTQQRVHLKPTLPNLGGLWVDLEGDDTLTGGVGGWEKLPRPRRPEAVAWRGTPGMELVLPLLFDGLATNTSVEQAVTKLQSWGRPHKKTREPVVLQVTGPVRVLKTSRWVIDSIEWGAQVRDANGRRVQQQAVVTLFEYRSAQVLKSPAAKHRNKKPKGGKGKGKGPAKKPPKKKGKGGRRG